MKNKHKDNWPIGNQIIFCFTCRLLRDLFFLLNEKLVMLKNQRNNNSISRGTSEINAFMIQFRFRFILTKCQEENNRKTVI